MSGPAHFRRAPVTGAISVEGWETSISFMRSIPGQQVLDGLKASDIVDESLLP